MQCVFTSWTDFINMGGFAGYVWGAYGLMFFGFIWGIFAAKRQQRQVLKSVADESQT